VAAITGAVHSRPAAGHAQQCRSAAWPPAWQQHAVCIYAVGSHAQSSTKQDATTTRAGNISLVSGRRRSLTYILYCQAFEILGSIYYKNGLMESFSHLNQTHGHNGTPPLVQKPRCGRDDDMRHNPPKI
jgi:hypothetical protein